MITVRSMMCSMHLHPRWPVTAYASSLGCLSDNPSNASGLQVPLVSVRVLVAYDIVSSRDASVHTVRSWGEALDPGDKGTAKALSSAYKGAMLQVFCIPVAGEDADATSHKVIIPASLPRPAQGWVAWSTDILDMIRVCESCEALDRVRTRYEALLHGLRRECPDLYAQVGNLFTARASQLATPSVPPGKAAKNILEEADD